MNDIKKKFPIGELPQSASPNSSKADEIAEKRKIRRSRLSRWGLWGF